MERLKIKRTTKYGVELVEPKEDGGPNYRNTTEAVRNFLSKQCPCEVEVQEMEGNEISRVKVINKGNQGPFKQTEVIPADKCSDENSYWNWRTDFELQKQKKIEQQFYEREALKTIEIALKMIELNNSIPEREKIIPTASSILDTTKVLQGIIEEIKKKE